MREKEKRVREIELNVNHLFFVLHLRCVRSFFTRMPTCTLIILATALIGHRTVTDTEKQALSFLLNSVLLYVFSQVLCIYLPFQGHLLLLQALNEIKDLQLLQ